MGSIENTASTLSRIVKANTTNLNIFVSVKLEVLFPRHYRLLLTFLVSLSLFRID